MGQRRSARRRRARAERAGTSRGSRVGVRAPSRSAATRAVRAHSCGISRPRSCSHARSDGHGIRSRRSRLCHLRRIRTTTSACLDRISPAKIRNWCLAEVVRSGRRMRRVALAWQTRCIPPVGVPGPLGPVAPEHRFTEPRPIETTWGEPPRPRLGQLVGSRLAARPSLAEI